MTGAVKCSIWYSINHRLNSITWKDRWWFRPVQNPNTSSVVSSKRTKRRKIENWDFIRLDLFRATSLLSSSYHLPRNLCICPSLYHLAFQCIYWALTVCEIDTRTISCSVSPGFDDTYPITVPWMTICVNKCFFCSSSGRKKIIINNIIHIHHHSLENVHLLTMAHHRQN